MLKKRNLIRCSNKLAANQYLFKDNKDESKFKFMQEVIMKHHSE